MRLSQNFTLTEMIVSAKAAELGIKNDPTPEHLNHLYQLAFAAECLRSGAHNSMAMIATSAYRSPAVNKAVKGEPTSAHPLGYAIDYYVVGQHIARTMEQAAAFVQRVKFPFDQLIYEPSRGIVHLSVDPRYRRQILTQAGGPGSPVVPYRG